MTKPNPGSKNIPARLKQWREAQSLTQNAAASLLGVKVATLRDWEQGRHSPGGLALKALLDATKPAR